MGMHGAIPPSQAMVVVVEGGRGRANDKGKGKKRAVVELDGDEDEGEEGEMRIGLVSVTPSTGDVLWDSFIGEFDLIFCSLFQGCVNSCLVGC
jgi:hypothetical protein